MPKKLSKIGEMFRNVKEAAAAAKRGAAPVEDLEEKLEELEHELDEHIIYVDDDGNEISPYGNTAPKKQDLHDAMTKKILEALGQKQATPKPKDKIQQLAEMLSKLLQMRGQGMSRDAAMQRMMQEYIQNNLSQGASPAEQMQEAYDKRKEFERDFQNKLMQMMLGAGGGSTGPGSGLSKDMADSPYQDREEEADFDRHLLEKKSRSKEERGLQRIVRSILTDNKFDRFIGRKTRGRLDSNGLHRFPTNGRIFGQREERKGKHYTATILVDLSSSMDGRIQTAAPAAMRFHQLLAEIIPVQVRGYNNSFYKFVEFGEKLGKNGPMKVANRMVDLVSNGNGAQACIARVGQLPNGHPKYGVMNLPLSKEHQRIIKENGSDYRNTSFDTRGTLDGVAIRTLADQLSQQPGKHIVIVLNDGGPGSSWYKDVYAWQDGFKTPYTNENLDLKKAVEYAMKRGIMFVGIGIHSDEVLQYYPKKFCTVVDHGDDIGMAFAGASKQLQQYVHRG